MVRIPGEMFMPIVPPWMIERDDFFGDRIGCGNSVILRAITTLASQSQVVRSAAASSGKGNNVFNGKSLGRVGFPTQAVFAISLCAFPDQLLQFFCRAFSSHVDKA